MQYQMSENVIKLYGELIEKFKTSHGDTCGLFITYKGIKLPEKHILFVGRDTNGMKGGTQLKNIVVPTEYYYADIKEDLMWLVKNYYFKSSAFWGMVGKSASELFNMKYEESIFNSISWSNLYRVSNLKNNNKLSSTDKKHYKDQVELCSKLLVEEIRNLKPSAIVFLTGESEKNGLDAFFDYGKPWDVSGYIKNHNILQQKTKDSVRISTFDFDLGGGLEIPSIVVPHPQGKKVSDILPYIIKYVKPKIQN